MSKFGGTSFTLKTFAGAILIAGLSSACVPEIRSLKTTTAASTLTEGEVPTPTPSATPIATPANFVTVNVTIPGGGATLEIYLNGGIRDIDFGDGYTLASASANDAYTSPATSHVYAPGTYSLTFKDDNCLLLHIDTLVSAVEGLENLNSLTTLDFRNNQLIEFSSSLPDSLTDLYLLGNNIASFTSTLPDSLLSLELIGNELTVFAIPLPDSLAQLSVSNNNLTSFMSILPEGLSYLDVSGNALDAANLNSILANLASNGPTGGFFGIHSQSPTAYPTGQGLADLNALTIAGNTVQSDSAPALAFRIAAPSMPQERYFHFARLLNTGKIFVVGGQNNGLGYLTNAYLYSPDDDTWTSAAAPTSFCDGCTLTAMHDGRQLYRGSTFSEIYDPSDDSWSNTLAFITARMNHFSVLLNNNSIISAGGWATVAWASTKSGDSYNPISNSWSANMDLDVKQISPMAVKLNDGRVLVMGGQDGNQQGTNIVQISDSFGLNWQSIASLSTARVGATATLLSNGKVLVAGGHNGAGGISSGTEIFNPTNNTWTAGPNLSTARINHTATTMADGKILIAGGNGMVGSISSTDIYDPVANTISAGPSLNIARSGHTAVLLADGRIVLMGGYNQAMHLGSVEILE